MVRGLYTAASGMLAQQHHIDILSNNLANVNTPGYRADRMLSRAFPDMLIHRIHDGVGRAGSRPVPVGRLGTGVYVDGTALSLEEGPLQTTGNPLDVAVMGEGFFLIDTEQGPRLTRDGGFHVAADGFLVSRDGHRVLGTEGQWLNVASPDGSPEPPQIDGEGGVWVQGQYVGALAVVNVDNPALLRKEGGNRLVANESSGQPVLVDNPRVETGVREGSNVPIVGEMVRVISAYRAYEAAQKAVQAQDELLGRAVEDVARL